MKGGQPASSVLDEHVVKRRHNSAMHVRCTLQPTEQRADDSVNQDADDALIELTELLQGIDSAQPLAKLNETTISDNNGGRIEL
jgi:hypothetical protein